MLFSSQTKDGGVVVDLQVLDEVVQFLADTLPHDIVFELVLFAGQQVIRQSLIFASGSTASTRARDHLTPQLSSLSLEKSLWGCTDERGISMEL